MHNATIQKTTFFELGVYKKTRSIILSSLYLHFTYQTKWKKLLYCIVLYCIVLYCIALHCIALYCIALHCIVFRAVVSWIYLFHFAEPNYFRILILIACLSCGTIFRLVLVLPVQYQFLRLHLYKHYLIVLSNSYCPDTYNTWRTICPKRSACNDLVSPPACCN